MIRALLDRLPDQDVARHLLSDEGEMVIDLVRHHWIVYWRAVAEVIAAVLLLVLAVVGPISLGWIFIVLFLGLVLHAVYLTAREQRDVFVITNMRVFRMSGVFSVRIATMPITRILDITVEKPLLGRLIGFGHFIFESAAQAQGLRHIRFIGDPDARDLTIQRVIQRSGLRGKTMEQRLMDGN
ncbi:PH domain-containing protein [Aeromicrobium wangtongii]|uniref:PH domain-containing protein n=1 Tax=Aeromicrobium wangtongii TaxID=2969247 RepID=UPI002016EA4C|nr:PH domain-containing protein [Aeromicrobium wangtongii]MCL3820140.1 PH domain-containing protein [Aeromicrobium wangtongii]